MRPALASLIALAASAPAFSADSPRKQTEAAPPLATIACKEKDAVPPDAFGFAAGSDVADLGSLGAGLEYGGAFGARVGRASAHGVKASLSYGLAPCVEIGPSMTFGYERATDPAAATRFTAKSVAGAVEMKGKVLTRDQHGFGLTFVLEPSVAYGWSRLRDDVAAVSLKGSGPTYGAIAKMLVDFAIFPERLYGALNLEYAAEATEHDGLTCAVMSGSGYCKASSLNLRGALAYKISDALLLGADVSHQRVYEGAFLNRKPGYAWFAGPNLFWAPNETISVNFAWATQIAGKAHGQSGGKLNLDDFSRHVVKAKLGLAF